MRAKILQKIAHSLQCLFCACLVVTSRWFALSKFVSDELKIIGFVSHDKSVIYHLQSVLLSLKLTMLWEAYANLTKVTSRSRLQQFASTIIQLALRFAYNNCMHKIPYFLCAPALHKNCCTMEIMLSSFDKCAGSQNSRFVNLHNSLKLQNLHTKKTKNTK